jgi:hypothetical protein
MIGPRRKPLREWTAWTLLVFFAVRACIPAGFMPAFDTTVWGGLQVVICTGSGAKTLHLNEAGEPIEDTGSAVADRWCPFVSVKSLALAEAVPHGQPGGILLPSFELALIVPFYPFARAEPYMGGRDPPQIS